MLPTPRRNWHRERTTLLAMIPAKMKKAGYTIGRAGDYHTLFRPFDKSHELSGHNVEAITDSLRTWIWLLN